MKIAISGKGGSGKTLFSASLAILLSKRNKIYAIDADPDANLGLVLGFNKDELTKIKPIFELKDIIEERTQTKINTGFFILNPEVDDIPQKYSLKKGNIWLLILGNVKKANSGCYCPENAFLKSLLSYLILDVNETVIIDLPAGIEILTRGSARNVDILFVMVEPSFKSIQTAKNILTLAEELQIKEVKIIANKIFNEKDIKFIKQSLKRESEIYIKFDDNLKKFEQQQIPLKQTNFFHEVENYVNKVMLYIN